MNFLTRCCQHAFTLIEVMVSVGIILMVAVLLAPMGNRMVESGKGARCLSNLRQLSVGCLAYSSDNDGLLIPMCAGTDASTAKTWRALIERYVGRDANVFKCPVDTTALKETWYPSGISPASYGLNYTKVLIEGVYQSYLHSYLGRTSGAKISMLTKPASTIMLADIGLVANPTDQPSAWTDKTTRGGNYGYARFPGDYDFTRADAWNIYPRHGGKFANVSYYDGHVGRVDVAEDIIAHPAGDPECLFDNQ